VRPAGITLGHDFERETENSIEAHRIGRRGDEQRLDAA
jgi:hypothetical protein